LYVDVKQWPNYCDPSSHRMLGCSLTFLTWLTI